MNTEDHKDFRTPQIKMNQQNPEYLEQSVSTSATAQRFYSKDSYGSSFKKRLENDKTPARSVNF